MAIKLETYYSNMSIAIEKAKQAAIDKGYTIIDNEEDIFLWQSMSCETYQTRLYRLSKNGKESKKGLNITLYKMPSGNYELTTYIN